ncbi:MAG: TldD/PmbA family protein [Peptococcaceae bacterium]|jgi:PmbA protein|nr:TldD/PmbA family protein [Peptococcaceae bacterium]MDH7525360.1 TldD/PmbA family protein [Peptococcaceae bacterium]
MKDQLQVAAEKVLERACRQANTEAEVFLLDSEELTVEVAEKKVENMKLARERGLGVRVISGGKLGFAHSSDLSPAALESVVEKALHNARVTHPDESWVLPRPQISYPGLDIFDEATFQMPVESKIELAQNIEAAARSYDRRVVITEKAVYHEAKYRVIILNSRGLAGSYRGSYCGGYAMVVASENQDSQTGFGLQYSLKYHELDPLEIGREAGEKAVRLLGAKTIPSGRIPVVLDPYTASSFLGVLQAAFSAEAVLKGKSFLQGLEGRMVASPLVTIVDDGTMAGRLGSAPFDGEGVPTARTVLVREGELSGFLHNSYTAKRFGVEPTGNSTRVSYKNTPEVGITNFYLKEGNLSAEELVKDLSRGLYVTDILGMHTANPVSGDFSLGAAGFLIEGGECTVPVKGVAIAGNLKEMLLDIDGVANDIRFFIGKGAPSVRLRSLNVSGT